MEAVLISIQPKWCELIASGKKTVEVRKTRPKLNSSFKCYIYETKDKQFEHIGVVGYRTDGTRYDFLHGTGKVIGEFVCKKIEELYQCNSGWVQAYACLSRDNFFDYLGIPRKTHLGYDKKAYGWLITDLVIYDKPKELSEFSRPCDGNCYKCKDAIWQTPRDFSSDSKIVGCGRKVTAPQSWCYVEELM